MGSSICTSNANIADVLQLHDVPENDLERDDTDDEGFSHINQYKILDDLGSGSFGNVSLCEDTMSSKNYAIKMVNKKKYHSLNQNKVEKIYRELEVWKRISHPNLVLLHEIINDFKLNVVYMVMDYVDGKSIMESSFPTDPVPEESILNYLDQLLNVLFYLHSNNIAHLDIKPGNILVTNDGVLKLMDYGCSRYFPDGKDKLCETLGTIFFHPPEVAKGLDYFAKKADMWSLGITLYCFITGDLPFHGETVLEIYEKISKYTLPENVVNKIRDSKLVSLMKGLLTTDSSHRYNIIKCIEVMKSR